jgi:hypothetical protein
LSALVVRAGQKIIINMCVLPNYYTTYLKIKELLNGSVVGTGSDYIVIQKEKKRYLLEILPDSIRELKNSSTPYGSQID